ncbi:MAG: aminotransferase class V-fold PLP-dependent enzyme [Gemmatimonadota bacterium]
MTDRRSFVSTMMRAGVALPVFRTDALSRIFEADQGVRHKSPAETADDELYWAGIQRAFDDDRTVVNLNNGGVSPTPTHVLDAMIRDLKWSNQIPVFTMWQDLEPKIETVRRELARMFGCDTEEMAVTRNASEANEIMILGLDLARGDEVIITNQNYGRMITTWEQRERREGIVIRKVSFKVPPPSDDYIVEQFRRAITPRTRVIELTHITNLTGQILPVREIVKMARERNIDVLVDGAHSFAHFPFTRDDLDCDYFGTSLHKWLFAPIGTGFLYVRKDRIRKLWPMMPAPTSMDENIRKYEEIGTHPAANHNAIALAVAFNRGIGLDRKAARLRYLRDRWATRLRDESSRFNILTPLDDRQSCAICLVNIEGLETPRLQQWLWNRHRVMTVAIEHPEFHGLRVTPSVYTTTDEVDLFGDLMIKAMKQGIRAE